MTVLLTLTGTQWVDGEADTVTQKVTGVLDRTADGWRLTYTDNGVPAVLQTNPSCVTLTRGEDAVSAMVWEKGKRHTCEYQTPYGVLPLGLTAKNVAVALDDNGGKVVLAYILDQNEQPVSANTLEIAAAVPEKG